MNTQSKIEAANANEAVNTVFQVLTITMVGLFSLAEAVKFVASAMV